MKFKLNDYLRNLNPRKGMEFCQVKYVNSNHGVYKVKYNGLKEVRLLAENEANANFEKVNFNNINWCKNK